MDDEPLWVDVVQVLYEMEGKGERRATMTNTDMESLSAEELKNRQARDIASQIFDEEFDEYSKRDSDVQQVRSILDNLSDVGLVLDERKEPQGGPLHEHLFAHPVQYTLTEKGFGIAHDYHQNELDAERERRRDRRQHEVNRSIAVLTIGLVAVGLIQATITGMVGLGSPLWQVNTILFVGVLALVVIIAAIDIDRTF
jgi:hypothetical protein